MLKNTRLQMIAVLAVGGLLGYIAASGNLQQWVTGAESSAARSDRIHAVASDPINRVTTTQAPSPCCPESKQGLMLARADADSSAPAGADDKVISFKVLLPANATLEIDGNPTDATGESRTFRTPALEEGKKYSYTLKATFKGKTITKKVELSSGADNSFDLRADLGVAATGSAEPRRSFAGGQAQANGKKPNILFIMGDDIGWMQPQCYHRGLMVGETPNIDRIANEGAIFMTYYAEQSCTAGRNAFFTGMNPLRTGMIPPQLPGSPSYLRPGTPALAKFLLDLGYTTGEFGKNHLGDHPDALPTAHGFQEFWGYLYHLDAMQGVSFPDINKTPLVQGIAPPLKQVPIPGIPPVPGAIDPKDGIGLTPPRPVLWMKSPDGTAKNQMGKDEGPLTLERSKTVDEEISKHVIDWLDRNDPKKTNKPFFCWYNPARMHVTTVLSDKYMAMVGEPGGKDWGVNEAGMKQMDDNIGYVFKKLEDMGEMDNTIIVFTTDNGAETFTFPDGGVTPFKGSKMNTWEGGMRAPCVMRWPGHIKPGTVFTDIFASLDWLPTFVEIAGGPKGNELKAQIEKGDYKGIVKTTLDGVNQIDYLTGKSEKSARDTFFYYSSSHPSAVRYKNWKMYFAIAPETATGFLLPGVQTQFAAGVVNLKRDPFEMSWGTEHKANFWFSGALAGPVTAYIYDWNLLPIGQQLWLRELETYKAFPPLQDPASYNLDQVMEQLKKMPTHPSQ